MKYKSKLILIIIIAIASFLRFYGLNWDQGFHLHPDERFLTMVATAMKLPHSLADYLNPSISTFNPSNIGFPFFVYGAFPLIFVKLLAPFFSSNTYDTFNIFGRSLSALADILVVVLVFKTVELFEKHNKINKSIKFWSAGFYAISVLPIQLAHFFAVDTFLNLFVFASFYFILKFYFEKKLFILFSSAVFLGLAIASKVTAIFVIPLLLLIIIPVQFHKKYLHIKNLKKPLILLIAYCLICYLTLRLADPYLFQSANLFDVKPNTIFLQNLQTLKGLTDPNAWYPPSLQWLHKTPIIFGLQNIIFFGLGTPIFVLVLFGIISTAYKFKKTKIFLILIWVLLFFIYQSTQITKTMRYFIVLYPFFAIFGGIGFVEITKFMQQKIHNKFILNAINIILYTLILIWPLSFFSIYTKPHSRIEASTFIYNALPNNSNILSEYWDDALPLQMPDKNKQFNIKEMPVFGKDDPAKWTQMRSLLEQGDYIILSSNRGWGSIQAAPERYPLMSNFYADLFSGKLQYKKIATFTSYPSLKYLGIPIEFNDDFSEEAFTVYDHPKVMIFKKF